MQHPLIIVALTVTLTANSAEAAGYHELGAGTASCGIWTAFRHEGTLTARALGSEQWVLGFIDGVANASGGSLDPLNGIDAEGVWAWIDNYCQENGLKSVADAVAAFIVAHPR